MAPEEPRSVSQWIEALRQGDEEAPTRLWERYFRPLVEVARARLKYRRGPDDGEDAALSAFKCLFAGLARGDFDALENRDHLWRLLLVILQRKVTDRIRREGAQKRGGEQVRKASDGKTFDLNCFPDTDPGVEWQITLQDEFDELLSRLDSEAERTIILLKLQGHTHSEIAQNLGLSLRSIERKLQRVRTVWAREEAE